MSIRRMSSPVAISRATISGAAGTYSFVPSMLSGLALWLDASDTRTLYNATSGGQVVTNGNTIARWEDKSGNARHFTQSTANNQPTLRTNSLNGFATVEFDGTNDRLIGDSTQYVKSTAGFSLYIVYKLDSSAGTFPTAFATKTDQSQNWRIIDSNNASYQTFGFGSNSTFATVRTNLTTRGTWYVAHVDYNSAASAGLLSSYSSSINGLAVTLSTSGSFGSETGSSANVGAQCDGNNLWKGNVAELIIYNNKLSAANHTLILNYLKRWALY